MFQYIVEICLNIYPICQVFECLMQKMMLAAV